MEDIKDMRVDDIIKELENKGYHLVSHSLPGMRKPEKWIFSENGHNHVCLGLDSLRRHLQDVRAGKVTKWVSSGISPDIQAEQDREKERLSKVSFRITGRTNRGEDINEKVVGQDAAKERERYWRKQFVVVRVEEQK